MGDLPESLAPGAWAAWAACAGWPYDWWEAQPGTSRARVARALEVCHDCPVISECAEHGLLDGNRNHMVLGGLVPDERRELAGGWDTPADVVRTGDRYRPGTCEKGHDLSVVGRRVNGGCRRCQDQRNQTYKKERRARRRAEREA